MITRRTLTSATILALALMTSAPLAGAAPTPVPGGANQVAGVGGAVSGVVFNGRLRLRKMSFAAPVAADHAGNLEKLVFHALVSNGLREKTHGFFNATLADAEGITVTGRPLDDGWDLTPGGAARTAYGFALPAGFVPTRLVLIEAARPRSRAFRISIEPSDLPQATP